MCCSPWGRKESDVAERLKSSKVVTYFLALGSMNLTVHPSLCLSVHPSIYLAFINHLSSLITQFQANFISIVTNNKTTEE